MPRYKRTDRINELLRQEVAVLLRDQVRDPRVRSVTITEVETTRELDHARIYVAGVGTPAEQEALLEGLGSAAPFLRRELGRRLHMRRIPELHFQIDRVLQGAQHIEALLREAKATEATTADDAEPLGGEDGGEGNPAEETAAEDGLGPR